MQQYEVVDLIGEGAYGVVLKAKRKEDGSTVAIKKFKETDDDELIKKTTVRELKVLKSLRHKNIVELREAFKKKGLVHLVFEYLDNNLLEVLEKNHSGLQGKLIAKYIYQVLEGLDYMHSLSYIHRDIKPENLLVNAQGTVKICDMGFAKMMDSQMTDYVATRWYRPPELLVGAEYGPAIDIWAVGCIMAQLSDTQPLFPGADQIDQLHQIISALGALPDSLQLRMDKNKAFKGFINPRKSASPNFLQRYRNKLTDKGVQLLKRMLEMDPNKRISAREAIQHPYFDCIKPRVQRFQKTSENWIGSRLFTNTSMKESSNTERNRQKNQNITSLETIDLGQKENRTNHNKEFNFFKFGRGDRSGRDMVVPLKQNLGLNKIYRSRDEGHNKYLAPYRVTEKLVKRGEEVGRWGEEVGKCTQTSSQFKVGRKKREGSTYLGNC